MYLVSCKWVLSSNDTWCKRQDSVKENEYPETCSIPNPMEKREWISSFIDFPTVSVTLCSLEPYWLPRIMIQNKGFNLFKYKFSYINAAGKNSTTLGCHMAFVMPKPQNTVHLPNWLYWSNPSKRLYEFQHCSVETLPIWHGSKWEVSSMKKESIEPCYMKEGCKH